jgi:hypothetical protein
MVTQRRPYSAFAPGGEILITWLRHLKIVFAELNRYAPYPTGSGQFESACARHVKRLKCGALCCCIRTVNI